MMNAIRWIKQFAEKNHGKSVLRLSERDAVQFVVVVVIAVVVVVVDDDVFVVVVVAVVSSSSSIYSVLWS